VAGTSPSNWLWIGIGALETWGLIVARSRFSGFWLHPVGMVLPLTNPMWCFWFSIFLGWMFKASITRTFGYRGFRTMLPAFLGLALGDIAMMLFWLVVDCSLGIRQHILLPG
jgi:hypothetical protein